MGGTAGRRTLDYCVLRTCERMGFGEAEFRTLPYGEQLRLLAYGWLRINEEQGAGEPER